MSKAGIKNERQLEELGAVIVAAWFKILPEKKGELIGDLEGDDLRKELTTAIKDIIDDSKIAVEVIIDPTDRSKITIVIPQPPSDIANREDLIRYLDNYHLYGQGRHYHEDLGRAVVMGCGG